MKEDEDGKKKEVIESHRVGTCDGDSSKALTWIFVETLWSTWEVNGREMKAVYTFKTFRCAKRNQFRGMHDPWRMFGLCFSMCRKGLICINEVKNPEIKDQK